MAIRKSTNKINEIPEDKIILDDFDRRVKKFFLHNSYAEREGYYQTTYSFNDDYTCTMNVFQFDQNYDDNDETSGEEFISDYEVKIFCKNRFEAIGTISYSTRNKEWGGLEVGELYGKDEFIEWLDSNPKIVRWTGTD